MQRIFDYLVVQLGVPERDLFDIVFSLILALAIALAISQIYKFTHRGLSYELSFMNTLVLLSPIVASVMLFIRGDLVLSLGLIGSISIIRFRSPIKDTRDMVYLFWSIAVGLGCGTYNWIIVILASVLLSVVMFALHFLKYGMSHSTDFVLVVSGQDAFSYAQMAQIIGKHAQESRTRSQEMDEDCWEVIFELRFRRMDQEKAQRMVQELKELQGVRKISLLAPQIALPV